MSTTNIIYSLNVDNEFIEKQNNITEKIYSTNYEDYVILNQQNNEWEDPSGNKEEIYHSVILENPSRRLLSFAPPRNKEFLEINDFLLFSKENFTYLNNLSKKDDIYINEFVEGTFIHLFYDSRISCWEIATKRAIGGKYSYFHIPGKDNISYREMIMEAFRESIDTTLNALPFLEFLSKQYSYSFVLQHPSNHIVIPIHTPKMYLVSVYKINSEENTATFISPLEYQKWSEFDNLKDGIIYFPKQYTIDNNITNNTDLISECVNLIQTYASIHTPYTQMGLMFTNLNTGKRCSVINPNYEEMCTIRGNYTNIQYQYLCLRRMNKVMNFLKYFPQYNTLFYEYKTQYEKLIDNIHQSYISYYIQKSGKFISKKYFSIIYAIHHSIFIPSVKNSLQSGISNKIIIKRSVIKDYLNQLDPGKILHIINSDIILSKEEKTTEDIIL